MISDLIIGFFLSILLGAFVGVQREMKLQKSHYQDFAGFRTFTFISVLGYILGYLSFTALKNNTLITFSILGFFMLMSTSYYVLAKKHKKYISEISQITALLTFLIGILISLGEYYFAIVLSIVITTILVLGTSLHNFAKQLNMVEVYATMKFAIISFIILPVLPNKAYGPLDIPGMEVFFLKFFSESSLNEFTIFNFYHIWLMVVFISAITYVGYILMKILGAKRGILLTGVLGGLMSSTVLTSSFSLESKRFKSLANPLLIGIILASSIMFFRIIFEVAIVNANLLPNVLFLSIMGFVGLIIVLYLFTKNTKEHVGEVDQKSPFTLMPAIKFALFFFLIILLTKVFTLTFGDKGIYAIAFFSGFADVDVITLTLSKMALENTITNMTAATGIFIAALSNTIFKAGITYYVGSKELSKSAIYSYIIIVLIGLLSLIFL